MRNSTPPGPLVDAAREAVAAYGYRIDDDGYFIYPCGKTSKVRLEETRSGWLRAVSRDGQLLWSGRDATDFIRKFWFAKPVEQAAGGAA